MTLEERIALGHITVVESGQEQIQDRRSGFCYDGEYRILSDGRKQWRQLGNNGRVSPFWGWQDAR